MSGLGLSGGDCPRTTNVNDLIYFNDSYSNQSSHDLKTDIYIFGGKTIPLRDLKIGQTYI